jgi:predicted RecB family endonuclease
MIDRSFLIGFDRRRHLIVKARRYQIAAERALDELADIIAEKNGRTKEQMRREVRELLDLHRDSYDPDRILH